MLHGALTPPYCPALPAQMFGSISLCGGAKSNCAHPQNMSGGKNVLSPLPESCGEFADGEFCALPRVQINRGNTRIQANVFIPPPNFLFYEESIALTNAQESRLPWFAWDQNGFTGAEHCNLLSEPRLPVRLRLRVKWRKLPLRDQTAKASRIHIQHSDLFHS